MSGQWLLAAALLPAMLCGQAGTPPIGPGPARQGPLRQGPAWWESPWWNGPLVRDLDLSESQRRDIRNTVREYRGRLLDLREAAQRTDDDLNVVLNTSPLDRRKANEVIERLARTRADLARTLSQMTLRLRGILTDDQWQQLQQRAGERRGPQRGRGRRGPPPEGDPQP